MEIAPSLISSDLLNVQATLNAFDKVAPSYHIDIMDGHFVPNITWGPMVVNAIRKASSLPLTIHLMVDNPGMWLDTLLVQPNDTILYHYEAIEGLPVQKALIDQIKNKGCKVGIALKPKTSIEVIKDLLPLLDMVLLMSVEPGFSGQAFMPEVTKKIEPLRVMRLQLSAKFIIGMDGGINRTNITTVAALGADMVAVASAIFAQPEPLVAYTQLTHLVCA